MIQVFLAYLLALGGVQIELIEAFVQELVGADDCLLELSEALREFELFEFRERTGGSCGGPNVRRGLEELEFSEVYK